VGLRLDRCWADRHKGDGRVTKIRSGALADAVLCARGPRFLLIEQERPTAILTFGPYDRKGTSGWGNFDSQLVMRTSIVRTWTARLRRLRWQQQLAISV
jgi:hypothetical protein